MSRSWLALTVPACLLGLVVLAATIVHLVRVLRAGVAAVLPLAPQTEFRLDAVGPMLLNIEGPRFSSRFAGLSYTLSDSQTERAVALHGVLFHSQSSGVSTTRLSIDTFTIEQPGTYVLRVSGLPAVPPPQGHRMVITRDNRFALVATIVGIVLSAIAFIAGLVLSSLILVKPR